MTDISDIVWSLVSKCCVCGKELDTSSCPQLLPCCHSSCKECIEDNNNQLKDFSNTVSTDRPQFKCKICSQEYDPKDCIENTFQLIYWSKKANEDTSSQQICQSCEGETKRAVIKCQSCDWICIDCQDLHKTLKTFKGHTLDESTRLAQTVVTKSVCSQHNNEEITVYCKTCRQAFCTRCILKDHNLHVYEDTKDSTQLEGFYHLFDEKVDKVKEKRSFAENMIKTFESNEHNISGQRDECIQNIKTIVGKLQEKVSELGTSLLDKVNGICQQKESEFNQKKTELNELNQSFKFIEAFMQSIRALNDPMSFMRAQELLNKQLEMLLNKPCTHPDFLKPFKIEIIDALATNTTEGKDGRKFNVSKMIDGVFSLCLQLVSSDDKKVENINTNVNYNANDDDIQEIIEVPNSRPNSRPESQSTPTTTQSGQTQTFVLRGNTGIDYSRVGHNNYDCNYNNINQMQSHPTARPTPSAQHSAQRLHHTSHHLQNLNAMTNSVNQTGLLDTSALTYGCPQVYNTQPVANRVVQNSTVGNNVIPSNLNYMMTIANPPNTTVPNTGNTNNAQLLRHLTAPYNSTGIRIYNTGANTLNINTAPPPYNGTANGQTPRNVGTSRPTILYPASTSNQQRLTNSHLLARLNSNTAPVPALQPQTSTTAQQMPTVVPQVPVRRSVEEERSKERRIQEIKNSLLQTSEPMLTNNTLSQRSAMPTITTASPLPQTFTLSNSSYQLHIPEGTVLSPNTQSTPQPSAQPSVQRITQTSQPMTSQTSTQRKESIDRRQSIATTSDTIGDIGGQHNGTGVETVGAVNSRSHSVDSCIQVNALSMPSMSEISEQIVDKDVQQMEVQKELAVQTAPIDETSELPVLSNPPSNDSLFSELSATDLIPNPTDNTIEDNVIDLNKESDCNDVEPSAPVTATEPMNGEPEVIIPDIDTRVEESSDSEQSFDEETDCVVCDREFGEFLICSRCSRSFHNECHVPALKILPESTFICTFCKPLPSALSAGRIRKPGLNDRQQLICERVLVQLLCHKESKPFKHTIPDVFAENVNLMTVKKNLENKCYESEKDFIEDIKNVFSLFRDRETTTEENESQNSLEKCFAKLILKFMPSFADLTQNSGLNNNQMNCNSKKSKTSCNTI